MKTNHPLDARMRLLGLSTCLPSPELSRNAAFSTNEEYLSFLRKSQQDPAAYWSQIGEELPWVEKPRDIGKTGDWFPGGLLNISSVCLDKNIDHKGPEATLVFEYDPDARTTRSLSGGELRHIVSRISAFIDSWNIPQGSPILVALPGGADMVACMLACLRSGYPVVPIDPTYSKSRISQRFRMANCRGALCSENVLGAIRESDDVDANLRSNIATPQEAKQSTDQPGPLKAWESMRPAFILADSRHHLYTIPMAGFLVQATSAYKYLLGDSETKDTLWALAPSHHASTLAAIFGALASGCSIGTLPISTAKDEKSFSAMIEEIDAALLFADVKTVLEATRPALEQNIRPNLAGPDIFIIEGETLTPRVWSYLQKGFFNGKTHIAQVLSRPESGGFLTGPNPRITPVRVSSVGLAAPGVVVSVVELHEGECPVGEGGVLALAEPIPGLALELQSSEMPLPMQMKTRRDKAGYLWSMGEVKAERSKSEQVTLAEIEAAIASIDEVSQVAVIRYNDENHVSRTRAFVQWGPEPQGDSPGEPRDDADSEATKRIKQALIEHCGESALPDKIQFVTNLPYSRSGKLLRSVLRRISKGDPLRSEDLHLISDPQIAVEYQQGSDT